MNTSGTHAFVNQLLVGLLVTIGFGGSIGLGTVWMRHRISVVADNNASLQRQITEINRHITDISALVEESMSEDVLRSQNESMHLGLVALTQSQINQVPVDPVARLVARANRRVFAPESSDAGVNVRFAPPASPAPAPTDAAARPPAPGDSLRAAAARPSHLQIALNP